MKQRIYAMEQAFLQQLLADRKELYEVARSFGDAESMRAAREDLIRSISAFNVAPKAGEAPKYAVENGVAHIPIVGELTPKGETDICGAYTADALTEYGYIITATEHANANPEVESISYLIDSPGGYIDGVMDAAMAVRASEKPTVARVGGMMASAAYWVGSQADEIIAKSPASRIGSIGVAMEEYDTTQMLENAGITRRVYTSTDAPDKRPDTSTEEGRAKITAQLDDIHSVFVQSIAEGRNIDAKTVTENYGKGAVLIASKAMKAGMIDRIESVEPRAQKQDSDSGVAGESHTEARPQAGEERETLMNKEQLKTEYPDLYAELTAQGREEERARVMELRSYVEADPDNGKLSEVINAAIADGKSASEVNGKIQVAIRDGGKLDGENPPTVATASDDAEGLDAEDREAMRLMGLTAAEYKKYKGGE